MMKEGTFSYRRLMFTTFIISGCSIIYELLISSVSSYLLGDSIAQFSITIGLYMCAMGMGSYLSKYVRTELFDWFVFVEIGVGIPGRDQLPAFVFGKHLCAVLPACDVSGNHTDWNAGRPGDPPSHKNH
ncbi:MAG: hypothetical protein ACLTBV_31490 [Enterocloster bolteae]